MYKERILWILGPSFHHTKVILVVDLGGPDNRLKHPPLRAGGDPGLGRHFGKLLIFPGDVFRQIMKTTAQATAEALLRKQQCNPDRMIIVILAKKEFLRL